MKSFTEPRINHIDVKITYACNFKCEYCYQADKNGNRQKGVLSKEHAENLLKFIDRTGQKYSVALAGGEPFVYPHLDFLAQGLSERGCKIRVITNFSAPLTRIKEFVQKCNGNLEQLSISIHLSQWGDMDEFYDKLRELDEFVKLDYPEIDMVLTCVVTDGNFAKVKKMNEVVKQRFSHMAYRLQRVYYNGIYHMYTKEVEQFLQENKVDVPEERANNINFYGRMCWTGSRSFYIESNGDVMRCYTRQQNEDKYRLGNLSDYNNINLLEGPSPCISCENGKCVCYLHFEMCGFVLGEKATQTEIDAFRDVK